MHTYPLNLINFATRKAIVIGGGAVALRKVEGLLAGGATVTVISPEYDDLAALLAELRPETLNGVHKLIFDLRPTMRDHLGLAPALRWFAQSRLEPTGVRVIIKEECTRPRSTTAAPPCRLPPETETALFRVIQEAIVNIARHALARSVRLVFTLAEDAFMVLIEDDGIGFDLVALAVAPDNGRGLGLIGMQERIDLVGGRLEIDTAPGQGTRIRVQVPLNAKNDTPGTVFPPAERSVAHV